MSATLGWADALWLAGRRTPNDRLRFWGSALSSAVTTALVCTAAGLVALGTDDVGSAVGVVAKHGTRVGVVVAVLLVALPALHLTGQTWKLGSVERHQRLRQLRDAGAGPGELRRVVMADTVVPVAAGAVVGVVLLAVAISVVNLRDVEVPTFRAGADGSEVATGDTVPVPGLDVLPNVATTAWWPAVSAILVVTALAAVVAARSVGRADGPQRPRRTLVGWVAGEMAGRVRHPSLLIALRRVSQEPLASTRPALLLGLAGFVAGAATWLAVEFESALGVVWTQETFFPQSFALVRAATWVGVGLCALGLLVALSDAVIRRRRADAVAVAGGVPASVLRSALVLQAVLPAVLPVLLGLTLGGVISVVLTGRGPTERSDGSGTIAPTVPLPWLGWIGWGVGILAAAVLASVLASTLLRRTTKVDQVRVPA